MLVFAFDRDWTVDVNPHPHHDAVPLEWVRHLAHETPHEVYAIGNQTLAEEAAIPGVVDIVGRHPDDWEQWLGEKQLDGRYERFPRRRERLSLIADLHPDADGYVVVDDLDLSDVDDWEHYHAWEFVPAVEAGEIDPDLPWVREPVTDGGLPSSAGIDPVNPSMLSSFLEDYADAPGFEITYTDDGSECTKLLHSVSLDPVSLERPAAAPAVQCTPIAPGEQKFTVRVDAIQMLSVVEPPTELYMTNAETAAEKATGLRRLADVNPRAVRISSVLALLDREEENRFRERNALRALRHLAIDRPADCTPAIPILRSLLEREDHLPHTDVLVILRAIGESDPGAIAPIADELVPYLDSDVVSTRREAARCIAAIAEDHPGDAVDAVPALATIVEDRANGQQYAVYALSRITTEFPEEVKPVSETFGDAILDESLSDSTRLSATAGLGRIVSEYPSIAVDLVDDVTTLFDADHHKLRNNAIALLADVAIVHTDVVEPYSQKIAPLLDAEDTYTRINASGVLSRIAEDFPDSIDHLVPTFIELLSDEDPLVRENACWALGHLSAEEATSSLEERATGDEEADVRTRASWALAQIDG